MIDLGDNPRGPVPTSEQASQMRAALGITGTADLPWVSIADYGATAGSGVSGPTAAANTAAIQAALDTGNNVLIPAGTWEIDAALTWDLDQTILSGVNSRLSILKQVTASEHCLVFTTSPEAVGVTKSGIIERLRIEGVGAASSPTGHGLYAYKESTPSNAMLRGRDLWISGFATNVYLDRWDNCEFIFCEIKDAATNNVYVANQTRTLSFRHCQNSNAEDAVAWRVGTGGSLTLYGCDTGGCVQHVNSAGSFKSISSNFEAVSGNGSPNGVIESTAGTLELDGNFFLGGSSTLPVVYWADTLYFGANQITGFGTGGGEITPASASARLNHYGGSGLASNRTTGGYVFNAAGSNYEMLPPGQWDAVLWSSESSAVAANRGLLQYCGASTASPRWDFISFKQHVGSGSYDKPRLVACLLKTTTGDPSGTPPDGALCVNTVDNTAKIYADGAWRTIASGW